MWKSGMWNFNKNVSCLVIDDDPEDQEFFLLALNEAFSEARCSFASSCMQAIENLQSKAIPVPDYIFMDWNMPLMNGLECIQELKKVTMLDNSTVFILTGSMSDTVLKNVVDLGVNKVLQKQNSISMLSFELKNAITPYMRNAS
jgi:CheY-like chemotaxis protein